jgi:carbon-monoxide dehydrogenase large subunit
VNRLVPDMRVPPHPILAESLVHAVGMPVAAVVAEDVYAAYDALDLIGVDYEPLPALPQPEAALAAGAPLLFSGIDGNRALTRIIREGDAHRAFAAAARVVELRVAQNRISAVAMEPRSVLATFDRFTDELTMWVSCQAPFRIRGEVARLLDLPEGRVRVIAPDVGGGFGVKTGPYREDVLLAWLARSSVPVKWVATRREDQVTTNQARGSVCEGALALDAGAHHRAPGTITPLGAQLMNAAAARRGTTRAACPGPTWSRAATSRSMAR